MPSCAQPQPGAIRPRLIPQLLPFFCIVVHKRCAGLPRSPLSNPGLAGEVISGNLPNNVPPLRVPFFLGRIKYPLLQEEMTVSNEKSKIPVKCPLSGVLIFGPYYRGRYIMWERGLGVFLYSHLKLCQQTVLSLFLLISRATIRTHRPNRVLRSQRLTKEGKVSKQMCRKREFQKFFFL